MDAARRFLFVSIPAVAHVAPMASIANELASRGHEVAFLGFQDFKGPLSDQIAFHPIPPGDFYAKFLESESGESVRATAAAFVLGWQNRAVPLFHAMYGAVESFAKAFRPDVMFVDQHCLAGTLVARQFGVPWATSSPSAELIAERTQEEQNTTNAWLAGLQGELLHSVGIEADTQFEPSPHLVLLYTTKDFAGPEMSFPPHFRFVGANVENRHEDTPFPWDELEAGRKHVYVSLGSIIGARGGRFMQTLVEALSDQPFKVIVSDPKSLIDAAPPNFIVRPWVPQVQLLPKVDVVVTHGGSTVSEALGFGIPLVVAPYHLDNFIYATKVVECGAGRRVSFGRPHAGELREAVTEVIANPLYRESAARIRASFAAAGGTKAAADALAALA